MKILRLLFWVCPILFYACDDKPFDEKSVISFEELTVGNLAVDSYSRLVLRAKIDANADHDKREITFSTDNGKFTNDSNTIVVTVNQAGIAETSIKAEKIGTATVKATVSGYSAMTTINFVAPNPEHIYQIGTIPTNVPADGVTPAALEVLVDPRLSSDRRSVSFFTDLGTFQNGADTISALPASDGKIQVYLKSRDEGLAHLSTTANGVIRKFTVDFKRAFPDRLTIETPLTLQAGYGYSTSINVNIFRSAGTPSKGFDFDYSATDLSGNEIGIFNNPKTSDIDGKASVTYSTMDTVYTGNVFIKVSLKGNSSLQATGPLRIIK